MSRGFGLLEVVISASIILVFFVSMMGALVAATRLNERNLRATRASFLLSEGVEVVKMLRADSWQNKIFPLSPNTPYSLLWTGTAWQSVPAGSFVDGIFDRRFTLGAAYRDGNRDLAAVGAADDGTRLLTVTVSWSERGATTTASSTTYITNLFNS